MKRCASNSLLFSVIPNVSVILRKILLLTIDLFKSFPEKVSWNCFTKSLYFNLDSSLIIYLLFSKSYLSLNKSSKSDIPTSSNKDGVFSFILHMLGFVVSSNSISSSCSSW